MTDAPPPDTAPEPPGHLYDAASSQREKVIDGFAGQREALMRAVEEQRIAAMPERFRPGADRSARAAAEIVEALQQMVAREVTRQLEMAVMAMLANAEAKVEQPPPN